MLAIVEMFANISAFGSRADEFKELLLDFGMLETAMQVWKNIKDSTDLLIELKCYIPEEKFATFAAKNK